jgi:MEDS: MEthanogen/methylotroph, DcmR Sensory domain
MQHEPHRVSLGFADETFPAGVHICQIFGDEKERLDSLLKFLRSGLEAGERTACFTEKLDAADFARYLADHGLSCDELTKSGAFSRAGTSEVYFQDGRFDPDRMLGLLRQYHEDSVASGFPAARVIGEMTADVQHIPGGSRLMEYESRVSLLLKDHPVTAICQYDASAFDGATIMQVLKVHPLMVIRGSVVHNPFFVPPEEFLARHG